MATSQRTIDFLVDQLRDLPAVRASKMFGEYAIYCGEKLVALVCDDQLFVKITEPGKTLVGKRYVEGFPYPGAKPSILIGAEVLEDPDRLAELFRVTAAALPAPRPKKHKKPKVAKKPKTSTVAKKTKSAASKKATSPRKRANPSRNWL
jgi:DNA transformation protein